MPARAGLDLGSSSIKVVELSGDQGKFQVEAIGLGVNPVGNLVTANQAEVVAVAEAVKKVWAESGCKLKKVRVALSEAAVYTRIIQVPPLSEAELASALSWEAEQFIPVPLSEVNLDWEILARPEAQAEAKKMEVLLVAAPKAAVDRLVGWVQVAGLEVESMETETLAVTRAVTKDQDAPTLMVDLGASGTTLVVVERGRPVLVHRTLEGGIALTRGLAQTLSLDFKAAEEYKRTYGVEDQLEGRVKQALQPVLGAVVAEMKKALNFYAARQPVTGVKRLILVGGGSQLPGVGGYLAALLNMEVVTGNPFGEMTWNEKLKTTYQGLESVFAVAVGLAKA